jgi:fatty acid desaturase
MNLHTLRRRPDVPAALTRPATLPDLLKAAAQDWLVILACWGAMALGPAWLLPVGLLIVTGRLHALGVVLHDACHLRRTASAGWRWLELLAGYPITTTLAGMRYHHLRHHRHNGTALDPYFKAGASERIVPAVLGRARGLLMPAAWIVRSFVGSVALFVPGLRNVYGRVFFGDRSGADLRRHAELLACLRAEPGQAVFFVLLVPVAMAWPLAFAVGYALPLCLAGLCNANRVIAEHLHVPVADNSAATTLATTRTHTAWWQRWLLYPRNIGYHAAHHLHPNAAMRQLPALHAWYLANEPLYAEAIAPRPEPGSRPAGAHPTA